MRSNLPITNVEYPIDDDTLIVSKTDTKGKLTYFNDQFVAASGFTEQDLMGQPHNIVRHPDMPSEAFADLWATLKAGKPWAGAVKNRRKNGDFYWVLASATPIWDNGQITGYMSIRSKLSADQRQEAEHVYGLLRAKKAQQYKVEAGIIRRRSLADRFAGFTRTLKARQVTTIATLASFMLIIGVIGILAAQQANRKLQSVYNDRAIPLYQVSEVTNRMQENILVLYQAVNDGRAGKPVGETASVITENIATISKAWAEFTATAQPAQAKIIADAYATKRAAYVEQGLKPALPLLAAGKFDELSQHLARTVDPLFVAAKQEADKLLPLQVDFAKAEYDDAQRNYETALGLSIGILIAGLALGAMLGLATIRAISRPIDQLNDVMAKIAQGRFNSRVVIERDDELGVALRNLQALQAKLGFDREEQKDTEHRIAALRRADMQKLAGEFEVAVGEIVATVSLAAGELETAATTLTKTAETTQKLSTAAAGAAEEASINVQSVAASTEEMAASVNEIGRQVQESSRIAGEAVEQAKRTDTRITKLSQAAVRIGDITKLITTIAEQTNLLALNATIEAARAGDAGKGFAVVAQEVKALASQTAKATGEISSQIAEIQSATQDSVVSIKEISGTIGRVSEIASTIAAAVEEQGAATQEISRNVQQAALGTNDVASNITHVNRGAAETGSASSQVLSSAQSLANESSRLKLEMGKFLTTVRTA